MSPSAHGESHTGATVEWYTPRYLFEAIGLVFDLDPAMAEERVPGDPGPLGLEAHGGTAPIPWVPARTWYTARDDGLALPWHGTVWLNPPYGPPCGAFLRRLAAHGDGLALVYSRTETDWWQEAAPLADAVLFLRDRVHHIRADGYQSRPAMGSALLAYGTTCAARIATLDLGWLVAP